MANDKVMEALARMEHKLDLVLGEDSKKARKKVGDPTHCCSLCHQTVDYQIDLNDSVVIRKCGCSTGKIAIDLKAFAPPVLPAKRTDNGRDDEQEDRNDSGGRHRGPSRR